MSGAQGNALDWALALARAPGERYALRQRALPGDIDTLIQIAGGGGADAVAKAAASTGESPAWIVEASRFYLREVLFFPEADAYRLLGVANDAEQAHIRSHHRLLQHWLHPDRCSSEDAIFAARVNVAWDQLRQPDRRAAYDLSRPAPLAQDIAADAGYQPLRPWIPVTVPDVVEVPPQERWRRRVPLLALLSACVALGVITVRHQQSLDDAGSVPLAGADTDDGPLLRVPPRSGEVAAPVVAARRERPSPTPAPVVKQAPVTLASDMTRDDPFQSFVAEEDPEFAMPVEPERERIAAVEIDAAPPARRAPPATPLPAPATPPQRTIAAVVPERTPAAAAARVIAAAAPARTVAVTAPPPPPVAVAAPVSPPVRQQRVAVAAPPPQARAMSPAATASASPKLASAPTAGAAPKPASASIPAPTAPDPRRVAGARQVGERLLAYLVQTNRSVPPIWDSLSAERAADHVRNGIARGDGPRFASPDWRISEADASLQAGLRYRDGREGRVRARLTWREQRWLVSDLSMEQDW